MSGYFKSFRRYSQGFEDQPNEQEPSQSLNDSNVDESHNSISTTTFNKSKTDGKKTEESQSGQSSTFRSAAGNVVWKTLLVALLSLIGAAAGFAFIYGLLSRDEKVTEKYFEYADHIAEQSLTRARQIHAQMAPINFHWTSHATNSRNDSWPFVSLPDYHSFAQTFAEGASELVAIAPIVTKADQEAWEDYSVAHQGWTHPVHHDELHAAHGRLLHSEDEDANSTIPTRIYYRDLEYDPGHKKEYRREETGSGPFAPLWQMYPVPEFTLETRDLSPVNYNVLSHPSIARAVQAVEEHQDAIITEPFHLFELFGIHWTYSSMQTEGGNETMTELKEPHSVIVSPVYRDFWPDDQDKEVVAVVLNVVPWREFFRNLLPKGENGIVLVLESHTSKCGETFTFQINGQECEFLGYGDLHDVEQDFYDTVSVFGPFMTRRDHDHLASAADDENGDICRLTLHVYPSNEFYHAYHSDIPRIFAAAMVGIFLFVCAVLKLYNWFAAKQERRIQLVVKRSNAIVEKFFPSEVRNRLLEEGEGDGDNKVSLLPKKKAIAGGLLTESKHNHLVQLNVNQDNNAVAFQGKPIATLFPQCTVMFAQIVGFTEWGAERSPEDTFTLLESCYREFDELTKRRKVFKVETIGDCYLAVTGLPEPQKEHALIMARFSRAIMQKFRQVIEELESTLGQETANLKLRVGLHSGPVTAGVLRGQKTSHFQLFGDTVNTASRMQSTGATGRIQVSVETATLLEQSSSSKATLWLSAREEKIVAKGKGEMSTFWLSAMPHSITDSSSKARSSSAGSECCQSEPPLTPPPPPPQQNQQRCHLETSKDERPSILASVAPPPMQDFDTKPAQEASNSPLQAPTLQFPAEVAAAETSLVAAIGVAAPKVTSSSRNSSFADLLSLDGVSVQSNPAA